MMLKRYAWCLFEALRRLPGQDDKGEIDLLVLRRWISEVRRIARDRGLIEICDDEIGQWLSRGSMQEDSPWPRRPICEALQYVASEEISSGFRTHNIHQRVGELRFRSY